MHRSSTFVWSRQSVTSRLIVALLVALLTAGAITVVRPVAWSPICMALDPETDFFLWLVYGCWIDPPPKDPRA